MSNKNLVTQGELGSLVDSLTALAENLNEHVNQSLSYAHGWSVVGSTYRDAGGNYDTDYGGTGGGIVSIPGLYNTGVNSDGSLANPGSTEQHWQLVLSAAPSVPASPASPAIPYVMYPLPSGYAKAGPLSQAISPAALGTKALAQGVYEYQLTFSLAGFNPSTVAISGVWSSQGPTTAILLNGVVTGYSCGPGTYEKQPASTFNLTGPFNAGSNSLVFVIKNAATGPTSLRVEISGTTTTENEGVLPIKGVVGTGVDLSGNVDQNWTLVQSAAPAHPGPNAYLVKPLNAVWAKNGSASFWISAAATAGVTQLADGTYTYQLSFDLTGLDPSTATLTGYYISTYYLVGANLNGQPNSGVPSNKQYGVGGCHSRKMPFIISSGFQAGINTLDFVMDTQVDFSGIQIAITGTAAKPIGGPTGGGNNYPPLVLRLTVGGDIIFIPCQHSGGLDSTSDPAIPVSTGITSPQSADPAQGLTVGSPAPSELVTTFADVLSAVSTASSDALLAHAGTPAEDVHGDVSLQAVNTTNTANFLVGRSGAFITLNGITYMLVGDTNLSGPLNS